MTTNSTNTFFINYADERFYNHIGPANSAAIDGGFHSVVTYNRRDITGTQYYHLNKNILDQPRGGGFWLWKPIIIKRELDLMKDGDLIVYMDIGDRCTPTTKEFLEKEMEGQDTGFVLSYFLNKEFTKRDTFILMNCDKEPYYSGRQLEAGLLCFRKTSTSLRILDEWAEWLSDPRISTDQKNELGENLPEFRDSRHDQSCLSLMTMKYNLFTIDQSKVNGIHLIYNVGI